MKCINLSIIIYLIFSYSSSFCQSKIDDQPYDLPLRSIAWDMLDLIEEKSVTAAIEFYRSQRVQHPDDYDFGKGELNTVVYYLLRENRTDEAIAVFKLNVEVYPDYANGWDSLAEACMLNGDKESAIKYYEKCLKLNPASQNAKLMLNTLNK